MSLPVVFRTLVPTRLRRVDTVEPRAADCRRVPTSIKIGIAVPFLFLAYDYVRYAARAWFFGDDFIFIDKYHDSMHFGELLHPQGFGRFVSINMYWNVAWRLFGTDARFYFALNLLLIVATAVLVGRLIAMRYGSAVGVVAALLYAALPNVIAGYKWISNSQHLLAHFFCALFFVVYFAARHERFRWHTVAALEGVLLLALLSNQLAYALAIVPIVDLAISRESRRQRSRWVFLGLAVVTALAFYVRTRQHADGIYYTNPSIGTVVANARFYFGGHLVLFACWLAASVTGFVYAARKKDTLLACMIAASGGFMFPFLILEFQRTDVYIALGLAFFLIAVWVVLSQLLARRATSVVPVVALAVALAAGAWGSARFGDVLSRPVGADQRQVVAQMRDIVKRDDMRVLEYCFTGPNMMEWRFDKQREAVASKWWGFGFGTAFTYFVDSTKAYGPVSFSQKCGRVVHINGSSLHE